jgi:hypothetical protein
VRATRGSAKLGGASNAAATGAKVCSDLLGEHPSDHGWSSREGGREDVGFAGDRRGPTTRSEQRLIAVMAGNGGHYVALPADKLVLVPRARSSTRYTVGRETENSSANSAIVCCPLWWSWTR